MEKTKKAIVKNEIDDNILGSLVLNGDLSKMSSKQKYEYYTKFCQSLGLNPLTQPFQIISFKGREVLYARRDATEQLRKIHGVSVIEMHNDIKNDVYIVKVKVQDKNGRYDISTGAVNIRGLSGETLANAIMKCETKAKRRATLSICGLGMLDESETDTIGNYETKPIEPAEKEADYVDYFKDCKTVKEIGDELHKLTHEEQVKAQPFATARKKEIENGFVEDDITLAMIDSLTLETFKREQKLIEANIDNEKDKDKVKEYAEKFNEKLKELKIDYEYEPLPF